MGLYYVLKNGEKIEIDIQEDKNYNKKIFIKLFGGSTIFEYDYYQDNHTLNEIISEIEENYGELLVEDKDFEYRSWAD